MLKILGLTFLILVFFANLAKATTIVNDFVCQSENGFGKFGDLAPRGFTLYTSTGTRLDDERSRLQVSEIVYYHKQGYVDEKLYFATEFEENEDTVSWKYEQHFIVTKINPQEIKTIDLDDGKDLLSKTSDWHHSINKKTLKLTLNNVSTISRDRAKTMIYANAEEFEWQCEIVDAKSHTYKILNDFQKFLENTVPQTGNKF